METLPVYCFLVVVSWVINLTIGFTQKRSFLGGRKGMDLETIILSFFFSFIPPFPVIFFVWNVFPNMFSDEK